MRAPNDTGRSSTRRRPRHWRAGLGELGGPNAPGRRAIVARTAYLACIGVLLAACGKPVGAPCKITGDGFHARHDCATKCLSRWSVTCPDGSRITPNVCAGRSTCQPGSCPAGQLCYHFDDPFEKRSYCIPDDVCGDLPNADSRRRWETDSAERAAATRAHSEAKRTLRSGAVTSPAEPLTQPGP
jgi:hypothetical protein